jgi:hypothetical protein
MASATGPSGKYCGKVTKLGRSVSLAIGFEAKSHQATFQLSIDAEEFPFSGTVGYSVVAGGVVAIDKNNAAFNSFLSQSPIPISASALSGIYNARTDELAAAISLKIVSLQMSMTKTNCAAAQKRVELDIPHPQTTISPGTSLVGRFCGIFATGDVYFTGSIVFQGNRFIAELGANGHMTTLDSPVGFALSSDGRVFVEPGNANLSHFLASFPVPIRAGNLKLSYSGDSDEILSTVSIHPLLSFNVLMSKATCARVDELNRSTDTL